VEVKNNYFTYMCSNSEAGSYLRLIEFIYHSTLGLRVIKRKKKKGMLVFAILESNLGPTQQKK